MTTTEETMMTDRKKKQSALYRVCKDSEFKMDCVDAAKFTAALMECSTFEILMAAGSFQNLERITSGKIEVR